MNAAWRVNCREIIETASFNKFLLDFCSIAYICLFYLLFLFIGICLQLFLISTDLVFVCSGLAYEIYNGGGSSMHIYCVVSLI